MDNEKLLEIRCIRDFLALDNEFDRFDYAADLALFSPGLDADECTEKNSIPGCDSGLYYRLSIQDGHISLITQSSSLLVKGLSAMLCAVLEAYPAADFANEPAGLADLLYARGLIAPERRKGLSELESCVTAFAQKCQ